MTNEEIIKGLQAVNEHIGKHFNEGGAWMAEFIDNAINELEQRPITWIVGKDNCQVAVRNMSTDKMQKICAIIGEEEQQPRDNNWKFYYDHGYAQAKRDLLCEDCVSRTDVLKLMCEKCPVYNCITGCQSYRSIEKMPSVTPQQKVGK